MKVFIFACLVAVALAKHEIKSKSSSEESSEEVSENIVQSEEQKANLNQQKKIKQFSQESSFPTFCMPLHQQQTSMNQWPQPNTIHNTPIQKSISTPMEEILKKIIDIVKSTHCQQQITIPQVPQVIRPQIPVSYWYPSKGYTFPNAHYMRSY